MQKDKRPLIFTEKKTFKELGTEDGKGSVSSMTTKA